ncbi:MAG: hypothetical protein ACRD09_10485 [Vicinamibacterales bacterium]
MRHLIRATSLAAFVVACATVAAGAADDKRPVRLDDIMNRPRDGHGLGKSYHQLDRLKRQRDWIVKYTLGGDGRKTTTQ